MARQDYDFRDIITPSEPEPTPRKSSLLADIVRAVGERPSLIPALAVRLGSGVLSAPGGAIGATIGGGGEALAQMIEGGTTDLSKLKKGRVAIEAGIGAIPFAKTISAGKALMSALKGGVISTVGTVGRKAADAAAEGSLEPLKQWDVQDTIPTVLGAGLSGALGKFAPPVAGKPREYVIEPTAQPGGQIKNPDGGGVIPVQVPAPIKGSGDSAPTVEVREPATVQSDGIPYGIPTVQTDSSIRKEGQEIAHAARNEKAREAYKRKIEKARADADAEQAARLSAQQAIPGLEPKPPTVGTSTSYTENGTRVSTSQKFEAPKPPKVPRATTVAGGALPEKPIVPQPDVYQILTPSGRVIPVTDAESAENLVNTLGPQARVIPPSNVPAAPRRSQPAPQGAPPITSEKIARLAESESGARQLEELEKLKGSEIQTPASARGLAPAGLPVADTGRGIPPVPPVGLGPKPSSRPPLPPDLEARAAAFRDARLKALNDPTTTPEHIEQLKLAGRALQKEHADFYRNAKAQRPAAPIADAPTPPSTGAPKEMYAGPVGNTADPEARLSFLKSQQDKIMATIEETAPPDLQIKIRAAQDKLLTLNNAGQVPSPTADKVAKELEQLRQSAFTAQHPDLAAELAAAAKAPKKASAPKISANPMFDPEAYRWAGQQLGSDGIGALVGGGVGALSSEDDPIGGAALGGLAGVLGSRALGSMRNAPYPATDAGDPLSSWDRLINWQRFALLSNPENLVVNFAAPTTSGALSSLEKILTGGIERTGLAGPITDSLELGTRGLGKVLNPVRGINIGDDFRDAVRLISEAERADLARSGRTTNALDRLTRIPADALTTGDIGARKALMSAGWSEDMARLATVTSNPRYKWLGEWITDIGKKGIGRFLLPFSRTAANVIEGSLERTPVVGILLNISQKDPALKATVAEIAAQQGMGGLVSTAAYMLGSNMDPETAREGKWPLYITNLSGQYGALAAAAFAAGQASQRDDSIGNQMRGAGYSMFGDVPLPTTQPASDIWNTGAALMDGEPPNPNAESPFQQWLPSMLVPRFLRDTGPIYGEDEPSSFDFSDLL